MKGQAYEPHAKVTIREGEGFFGPGIAQLLELLGETGSVKDACREMELSYTKGWHIINRAEEALGFALITRNQGGKAGGSSSLTQEGRDYLKRYRRFEADVMDYTRKSYQKHFER